MSSADADSAIGRLVLVTAVVFGNLRKKEINVAIIITPSCNARFISVMMMLYVKVAMMYLNRNAPKSFVLPV